MNKLRQKVIQFIPKVDKSSAHNVELFIKKAKSSAAFGKVDWDATCWNITDSQAKDSGHKQREYNLWFTQKEPNKIKRQLGQPFVEPFASFAKSLIRLRHEHGNQTAGNHMLVVIALRYLYIELETLNYNVLMLNTDHFTKAEQSIKRELAPRTARQTGVYLTYIARVLNCNRLTKIKIHFQTTLPTLETNDRLTKTAKERRLRLLPKKEALQALADISQKLDNDEDRIRMNIIKILVFTGFRLGEALTLPLDTIIIEETRDESKHPLNATKVGLRYWPEKGTEVRIKWLPTEAGRLVKSAIEELTTLTKDARDAANWLEKSPNKLKTNIEPNALFDMRQVEKFVGVYNGVQYCRVRNLSIIEGDNSQGGHKKWHVKFKHLEQAILTQRWDRPMLRLPNGKIQTLSQSLCVVFFEQLRCYHASSKWLVRPISETNISNFICGAKNIKTVFEKYNYLDSDGSKFTIRSHAFRHLLNTLANEGGLTDVELAWWFGRKSLKDNQEYDHRTAEQLTEKTRQMMLSGDIVGSIANAARQLSIVEAEEFVKTHVNAVHHTPYGLCMHDFAQTPCEKHLNCLSNCKEYHRTPGNQEERRNLNILKDQIGAALEYAKKEMGEGSWGANSWVAHHQNILSNIDKALAIDDPRTTEEIPISVNCKVGGIK